MKTRSLISRSSSSGRTPASTLILASASPRRAELMRQLGCKFRIIPSGAPEVEDAWLSATEVARINATRKAAAIAPQYPKNIVIGVDTVVALDTLLLGKPAAMAEAEQMLLTLSGKTHRVVTGVCLVHGQSGRRKVFYEQTDVTFRRLNLAQIRHYYTLVNPLDKAGAYALQEHGDLIVTSVIGSRSNVVGLPLERLAGELGLFTKSLG